MVAWAACDNNSYPILMSVAYESHETDYYNYASETGPHYYISCAVLNSTSYRTIRINMSHSSDGVGDYYGKHTWGYMGLQTASGSSDLSNIIVAIGYGHTVVGVTPSPSVTIGGYSVGIDFDWNQQDLYNEDRNYNSEGTIHY